MAEYILNRTKEIPISKGRKKEVEADLTDMERCLLRSSSMIIMWLSREARPDGLGTSAALVRHIKGGRVAHVLEANKLTQQQHQGLHPKGKMTLNNRVRDS